MDQPKKRYKVFKRGRLIATLIPGRYMGWELEKIFCRLDCKSAAKMRAENRIFFANWKDAVTAGYRECRKCKPRESDTYPENDALQEAVLAKLHIGIWALYPDETGEPLPIWELCLNWRDYSVKKGKFREVHLGYYPTCRHARQGAVKLWKKYNLPALLHISSDIEFVRVPTERTNEIDLARDKKKLKEFLKTKKVKWFHWMI